MMLVQIIVQALPSASSDCSLRVARLLMREMKVLRASYYANDSETFFVMSIHLDNDPQESQGLSRAKIFSGKFTDQLPVRRRTLLTAQNDFDDWGQWWLRVALEFQVVNEEDSEPFTDFTYQSRAR